MTQENNLNMLGNKPRRSIFDEHLHEEVNKLAEEELRRERLEEKLRGKAEKPNKPTPQTLNNKYSFLEGQLAEQVHDWITSNYQIPYIENINYDSKEKIIKGSNPFYVTAVNDYFRKNNLEIRTASQAELEQILKSNSLELEKHYEDTSLVLRSEDEPNKYLAEHLARQVKKRQELNYPLMIPLKGLTLIKDSSSPYKYSFGLIDETEIIYSDNTTITQRSILMWDGDRKVFERRHEEIHPRNLSAFRNPKRTGKNLYRSK